MRDCFYKRGTEIGDFDERDLGNNHFNELRTGMSVDENLWRNWSSQSTKSTRRTGSLAFRRRSGCSATLFNYCTAMKSISEAKLPINQKSSMSHRVARYLWLLRQLKCLTALRSLQQVSELCLYMPSLYAYIYMPSNSTVTTSKGDTTELTENEGLGVNICCSRASAPCQAGNKDGKSWNSPISTSIREKFSRANRSLSNALTSRSSKKTAGNKPKRKMEY